MARTYYVYILASESRELYVGMTNDDVLAAIRREKQIKSWSRIKRLELIDRMNPDWSDLAEDV